MAVARALRPLAAPLAELPSGCGSASRKRTDRGQLVRRGEERDDVVAELVRRRSGFVAYDRPGDDPLAKVVVPGSP